MKIDNLKPGNIIQRPNGKRYEVIEGGMVRRIGGGYRAHHHIWKDASWQKVSRRRVARMKRKGLIPK